MTQWHLQGVRFGVVGLASNLVLYLLYLLLTQLGTGPKVAMTSLFALGTIQTFILNKRWTFGHQGFVQASFRRYVMCYGLAFSLNLLALQVFVDTMGYPHQAVQAVMVISLAFLLFLLQRFWVFRSWETATTQR